MRSLRARLDKLKDNTRQLPELVIYQIGEDVNPESQQGSGVAIYLPDNHRDQERPEENHDNR